VAGCLESFAKVREAEARVAVDDFGGQIVVARVVASGCRVEELIDHCARNLAPYKVPRQIEFCEEL
jgi:acyl-coenzyme A synthetase/AMP-(fatty) acid ligase